MAAKFLDDNKPKLSLKSKLALLQTSSSLINFILRSDAINSRQRKNMSPRQEWNLWPSVNQSDALSTELERGVLHSSVVMASEWSASMRQRKNMSPRQELTLWPSINQSDALSTELERGVLRSSVVMASEWSATEGHRFHSCLGLIFFLCPVLVTCWSHHFSFLHQA